MAVIKISDNKVSLPPIIKITVGRTVSMIKNNSLSVIYNKPVI